MNHEFDLVKLIRTVRNIKIFIKKELMNDKEKRFIQNTEYNLIDIDDENDNNIPSSDSDHEEKKQEEGI